MWVILEFIVLAAIVLIFITEFFYPLLMKKPLFGSFRKKAKSENQTSDTNPLDEKIAYAKGKVEEVKKVQEEVTQNYKTAAELKDESDNLLK